MKPEKGYEEDKDPRHKVMWIPYRCEVEGCDKMDELSVCNGCGMVMYCSEEHQKEDWERHSAECRHIGSLQLISRPYLVPPNHYFCKSKDIDKLNGVLEYKQNPHECCLCDRTIQECLIRPADCCDIFHCDREQDYRPLTFSRSFCHRAHRANTMCGEHFDRQHLLEARDWRDCHPCQALLNADAAWRWHAMNSYNFRPPRPHHKGLMLTYACCRCKARIYPGFESCALTKEGTMCIPCSGLPVTPFPRIHHAKHIPIRPPPRSKSKCRAASGQIRQGREEGSGGGEDATSSASAESLQDDFTGQEWWELVNEVSGETGWDWLPAKAAEWGRQKEEAGDTSMQPAVLAQTFMTAFEAEMASGKPPATKAAAAAARPPGTSTAGTGAQPGDGASSSKQAHAFPPATASSDGNGAQGIGSGAAGDSWFSGALRRARAAAPQVPPAQPSSAHSADSSTPSSKVETPRRGDGGEGRRAAPGPGRGRTGLDLRLKLPKANSPALSRQQRRAELQMRGALPSHERVDSAEAGPGWAAPLMGASGSSLAAASKQSQE